MNYTYGSTSGGIRTLRRWKAADMFDCYQAFACRHPLRPRVAGFACAGLSRLSQSTQIRIYGITFRASPGAGVLSDCPIR